jgi:hypothetical protein
MQRVTLILCVVLAPWLATVLPADEPVDKGMTEAKAAPPPVAKLPRVLLIGDSISMGYTAPVTVALKDVAIVSRVPGNGQHTAYGLANLGKWLGKEKWDVIHFNWGIWDTHLMDNKTGALISTAGESKVDPESVHLRHDPKQYEENLTKLVQLLKQSGAKLIWANTTPVNSRHGDRLKVVPAYNEIAAKVMAANGIPIDDLNALVVAEPAKCPQTDGCHFAPAGYKTLADQVSKCIREALPETAKP